MDDSVAGIHHPEMGQAEFLRIGGKSVNLFFGNRVLNRFVLVMGRGVVVRHAEDLLRAETFQAPGLHPFESLRAGHLMAIKAVNIKLCRSVLDDIHHVRIPNLVNKCVHC